MKSWYSLLALSSQPESYNMSSNHPAVFRVRNWSSSSLFVADVVPLCPTDPSFSLDHCNPQPRDSGVRRTSARLGLLKSLVNLGPPFVDPLLGIRKNDNIQNHVNQDYMMRFQLYSAPNYLLKVDNCYW